MECLQSFGRSDFQDKIQYLYWLTWALVRASRSFLCQYLVQGLDKSEADQLCSLVQAVERVRLLLLNYRLHYLHKELLENHFLQLEPW